MTTPTSPSAARYAGYVHVTLPKTHPAYSTDPEGDVAAPRAVVVDRVWTDDFADLKLAIGAARAASWGDKDAVAVVRNPGDATFHVERLLLKPAFGDAGAKYRGVDLEQYRQSNPSIWQPLQSQRQVLVEAIVDGMLLIDKVERYKSRRP